ncbi:tumor necrosis factor receptor superfamily member 14 isoform X1 [Fundulus heteroclitus]|uniref:tumor necrosis factor receptor superfamily member 14 isoform X1 n=1 Tax=Fundulus heteroclitus TaxID=8078 RepID=UPI00165A144E|nr:tumor necrosis factor receptor superfamily member 14 isoform X1 [Fundulus heteroclitus]
MLSLLIIFVGVTWTEPGSACRPKEYTASDGQCCPMCHEGTVVQRDCTVQSGTRCIPCEAGTYMNKPNGLKRCFSCSSCAPGFGLFVKQNCTQTSDTVCDVLSGYFCKSLTDTGCSTAEKHSVCEPGQRIKQPGTSRHDTVCEACQEGSFSPDGLNCTLWTECSASQTKVQEGSLTRDVVCRNVSIRHRYTLLVPVLSLPIVCMLLLTGYCKTRWILQNTKSSSLRTEV